MRNVEKVGSTGGFIPQKLQVFLTLAIEVQCNLPVSITLKIRTGRLNGAMQAMLRGEPAPDRWIEVTLSWITMMLTYSISRMSPSFLVAVLAARGGIYVGETGNKH